MGIGDWGERVRDFPFFFPAFLPLSLLSLIYRLPHRLEQEM